MIVYISGGRHCSCENEAPRSRFIHKFLVAERHCGALRQVVYLNDRF